MIVVGFGIVKIVVVGIARTVVGLGIKSGVVERTMIVVVETEVTVVGRGVLAVVPTGLSAGSDLLVPLEGSAVFWCGLVTRRRKYVCIRL